MGYGIGTILRGHVHAYEGRTSFDFGHLHSYQGTSSNAYGGVDSHTHILRGTTSLDAGHVHNYYAVSGPGIPAGPGMHTHRYYAVTTSNGRIPHVHRLRGITAPVRNDSPL